MKPRLIRFAKLAAYPLFYLFCLGLFGYLCFPFDQLRSRIVAEFDRMQQLEQRRGRSNKAPMQLEIGELDSYWLTGIEVSKARLIIPPDPQPVRGTSKRNLMGGKGAETDDQPEPSVIEIDHAHARLAILPLFVGDVRINFGAEAFGGEISGTVPWGSGSGSAEVVLEDLQLGEVQPLRALAGLPVLGKLSGELRLNPKDDKFSKADGGLELRIERVIIGDGKAKLQGVALPAAQVGDFTVSAQAKDGTLKIEEISATGRDFELSGEGRIRIREQWNRSRADIYFRFRFTDAYRDKDDTTRSLLGAPGSKIPPALEFDPKVKRSKRPDGFYGWHVHGPLGDLKFDPQKTKGKARSSPKTPRTAPTSKSKKVPSMASRLKSRLGRGKRQPAKSPAGDEEDEDSQPEPAPRALAPAAPQDNVPAPPPPTSEPEEGAPESESEGGESGSDEVEGAANE